MDAKLLSFTLVHINPELYVYTNYAFNFINLDHKHAQHSTVSKCLFKGWYEV